MELRRLLLFLQQHSRHMCPVPSTAPRRLHPPTLVPSVAP